ncbi:TonB-dependent siderophore receptor [Vibrio sp. SCSIO 43137]|uniref:TonB-dependent siderophore receptor n=1 Tax=Vibrio sp. SCSIO 43137 TaxID=3021011 RepID=UPI0023079089|nr:TonB-dependent siderophore receptor [Vibrio sp. SCSIO 43137]WCE28861.1 TonB-dependent siderophore receptor [Vibrio sp. SCSIO 43137]
MDTNTNFKPSALTLALLAAFSLPALAEDTSQSGNSEIETVTVLGKTYRNTATKTVLEPGETPQTLNIIDSEQLEQRGVKSVMQALRYAPGVSTENKGGAVVLSDWINIRGFSSANNYYDGLMLPALPGWNVVPQIDPIAMERLEIFKGPTSVLYGTMPPGGMVNIIAKSPQLEQATKLGLATGSGNLREASIDTTGALADNVAYRLIALGRVKDTHVDEVKEERFLIAPSVDWYVSDKTFVNFNLYYQKDPELGQNVTLPLAAIKSGKVSPSTFSGDKNFNAIERDFLIAGYKFNHEFNSDWAFLQNFRYMKADLDQKSTASGAFNATSGELSRTAYTTKEDSKGISVDNQISGFVQTGDLEHYLLFGLDYRSIEGTADYDAFGGVASVNLYNPNNNKLNPAGFTKTYFQSVDVTMSQFGGYFQDQILMDNWVFIAGGRFDSVRTKTDTSVGGGAAKEAKNRDNKLSYRLGALYKFDNGLAPFANFATSFEPNAKLDAQGKNLDPETGEQIELGVKYESFDGALAGTASLFQIKKKNLGVRPDGASPYRAVGEVRSQGIELEGRAIINDNLDLKANYTYTDMEITEDQNKTNIGETPVFVPDHTASLWANYAFHQGAASGLKIGTGVRYVGETVKNNSSDKNNGKISSYTLVDASVSYDLGQVDSQLSGASANLIANNLFNKEYYTCWNESHCWYGQEQTIEFNVKYEF